MKKILVIEDEEDLNQTLSFNLENEGYKVTSALKGSEALEILENASPPDLVILDLMLPDMPGLDICRHIRSKDNLKNISVIIVTAKGEEVDRVVGFELGADDYIVKPYSVRELMLRIQAQLRRNDSSEVTEENSEEGNISFKDLLIDNSKHKVFLSDKKISLTAKEYTLLKYLLTKADKVQTRDILLDKVWGYDNSVTTRTVDTHVKRLRSKLGKYGKNIETIRGVGYIFNKI
jgi:two-component system phosphate regulon response regulator PhoB|tara:strand:- start:75 stop:773 length:699 start_codon:yes stop_codon:yes gene_type:complete